LGVLHRGVVIDALARQDLPEIQPRIAGLDSNAEFCKSGCYCQAS
jgi:hypothetical protein